MDSVDFERFGEILGGVFEVYGKDRSSVAVALWWKILQPFNLAAVEEALAEHLRTSRFSPTPADIVTALSSRDGRPTADVAWSMVPRDEYASACWTDEIAKACGVATPLLNAGDQVAARRAFIDAYEFEVAAARRAGTPVNPWMTWGLDASGRAPALARALELGMMKPERARQFLPQLPPNEVEASNVLKLLGADALKRIK